MKAIDTIYGAGASQYPVLIVPGYGSPAFQTELVGKRLRHSGLDTVGIKLPWLAMGDMVRSAEVVAEQVKRVRENLGYEKVNLLGYSLGGLVARYYLQEMEGHPLMARSAFVATPHRGTYIGYLGYFSAAGRQVRPGSPFIEGLSGPDRVEDFAGRCLSIFVRWDGVIVPSLSCYLPEGYNLMLRRPVSHWVAVMSEAVIAMASDFLKGGLPEGAVHGRELGMLEAGSLIAVPLEVGSRRRYWSMFSRKYRSFSSRLKSLFRR